MVQGHKTIPQFLANPKTGLMGVTAANIENRRSIDDIGITRASATGRCTSFVVKSVTTLSAKALGRYDWCIYDLSGHRVVRCRKTVVVIDSSSTITGGAFVLKDGAVAKLARGTRLGSFPSPRPSLGGPAT